MELRRDKKPDSPEGTAEVLKEFHGGEVWGGGEGDELGTGTLGGNESASPASWLNGSGWREEQQRRFNELHNTAGKEWMWSQLAGASI